MLEVHISKHSLCMMPVVTYFASIGIWIFDFSSTRLGIWTAPHSSALGTVCQPGTWPPKKPVRSNLKDVSHSGCNEQVATPNATCLTDSGVPRLPPEPSETTKTLSLAHSLKPLHSHILTSEHSASSLAGNQSRGERPWANKT